MAIVTMGARSVLGSWGSFVTDELLCNLGSGSRYERYVVSINGYALVTLVVLLVGVFVFFISKRSLKKSV